MEYLICSLCCLLCFACGVWAGRGAPTLPQRKKRRPQEEHWTQADDALSRDIAAMLAYTGPVKEEETHADT